jgi:DNA-binding CsgD family transcriptional regulator
MTVLSPGDKNILEWLLRGETLDQIGERLGKTRASVGARYRRALDRMQAYAENRPKKRRGKRRS